MPLPRERFNVAEFSPGIPQFISEEVSSLQQRLQKILAQAGIASRRAAEEMIRSGRVKVDGKVVTQLGTKVDPALNHIEVDGRPIRPEKKVYYLLYKPVGYITTLRDPQGRPTVRELLSGIKERVFPVGRLDYDTSGVLLLTNDGDLAHRLLHPRHGVQKTYRAKVRGVPSPNTLELLRRGVLLADGPTAPAEVTLLSVHGDSAWLEISIHEGRNRQIRRMGDAVGHPVLELIRTRFAFLGLEGLSPGQFRPLRPQELQRLRALTTPGESLPGLHSVQSLKGKRPKSKSRARPSPGASPGEKGRG